MFGSTSTNTNIDIPIQNATHFPKDTVECLSFVPMPSSKMFASADWTGAIKVYEIISQNGQNGILLKTEINAQVPVFSMHWLMQPSPMLILGCGDGNIKVANIQNGQVTAMGQHQGLIGLEIATINNQPIIITAGIDKVLKGWKPGSNAPMFQKPLPDVPLVLAIEENFYGISYSNMTYSVGTLQSLSSNANVVCVNTNLKSPINCLALSNSRNPKIGLGTVDGRIQILKLTPTNGGSGVTTSEIILFQAHK